MVVYQIENKKVTFYNAWDLDPDIPIVKIKSCTLGDVGKYVMFTDGSELFTKILTVSGYTIGTEVGLLRREDVVHCAIPKGRWSNYSGVKPTNEHPMVRPYTNNEKSIATRVMRDKEDLYITPRVKMLIAERLQEAAEKAGWTPEQGVENYVNMSKLFNMVGLIANDRLMIIHGIDPTKLPKDDNEVLLTAPKPLVGIALAEAIKNGTLQLPDKKSIFAMLGVGNKSTAEEAVIIKNDTE